MKLILLGVLFSILPVLELRAGLPLLYAGGLPLWTALLVAVGLNILAFPITYLFLNYLHKRLTNFRHYEHLFRRIEERYKRKIEHRIGTEWEYIALFVFVMIPLPGTGAYSGALISWIFNLDRMKGFLAVTLGVIAAGVLVLLVMLGAITIF